jgi:ubiquitin thioesterase OTU1
MLLKIVWGGAGKSAKIEVREDATLLDLKVKVAEVTGVEFTRQELRCGFPPKLLTGGSNLPLQEVGVTPGTALQLKEIPLHERFLRQVIDADNSCLFNALAFCLGQGVSREVVATVVASEPDVYTEALLGQPPTTYVRWIRDLKNWGGEIELYIFAKFFRVVIRVVDIQSGCVFNYGEGNEDDQQDQKEPGVVYLLYDGVHYDALKVASGVTKFALNDTEALEGFKSLASELKRERKFVDLGGCALRCMVCGRGLKGQKEALEHARATQHQNFGQV